MKKPLSLLLFVVLAWPLSVFGEDRGYPDFVQSLQNVEDFCVDSNVREALRPTLVDFGFDMDRMLITIELKLRSLGLPVVLCSKTSYYLVLSYLPVNDYKKNIYAIYYSLEFYQYVIRAPLESTVGNFLANTWVSDGIVLGSRDVVSDEDLVEVVEGNVLNRVDEFANDYLKANPPEPRTDQED